MEMCKIKNGVHHLLLVNLCLGPGGAKAPLTLPGPARRPRTTRACVRSEYLYTLRSQIQHPAPVQPAPRLMLFNVNLNFSKQPINVMLVYSRRQDLYISTKVLKNLAIV